MTINNMINSVLNGLKNVKEYMLNISENEETINQFNEMYNKVVNKNVYEYDENIDISCVKEEGIDYKVEECN
ncbi:MAG: hypothetical protein HFJ24_07675 [Clostridia bacterium]|nr:hypothetical protein [Clostridia bacterium]MCI9275788.1 hypothetical protein [Clostridia bacterium]